MNKLHQKKLHHYAYTSSQKHTHHTTSSSTNCHNTPSLSHQRNPTSTSSLLQQTLLRDTNTVIQNQDPVGDSLSNNKPHHITRYYFLNINGIQLTTTGGDINDICSTMKSADIDHLFAVEHNLDNTKSTIRHHLQTTIKKYFDHSRMTLTGSSLPSHTTYKPGGVLSISRDSYSGRINKTIHDNMGRWIHHSITGKSNRVVNVIACYKVSTSSRPISSQRMTAYSQQYSQLKIQNPSITPDPRTTFDDDLSALVNNCLQNKQEILLLGDFNEDVEHKSSGLKKIMEKYNLIDIFHQRVGHSDFNTFQSGSSRIDFALSTPLVAEAIESCGYDAFSRRIVSDHRGFYLDFNTKALFGNDTYILAPPTMRGISSNNMATNREYINHKFGALPEDFVNLVSHIESLTIPHHRLAEKLDNMLTNSSLYAEMKCRTKKRPPLPKNILLLRDKYNFYRKCLSEFKTQKTLLRPPQPHEPPWPVEKPSTRKECSECLRSLKRELRDSEKAIHLSLTEEFDDQLDEYIRTGNKKMETHLRNIRKAKETKSLFSKLNKMCKTILRENLNSIRIPVDKPTQPKQAKVWKNIDVPAEITKYLIQRNRNHFGQADGTPFTRPPLSFQLNYQGSTTTAELILEGDYQQDELNDLSNLFLSHMQRVTELDSIKKTITSEDYIARIKTWKETTSTSPSGLHLSHYHSLVKKHDLNDEHPEYHELERRRLLLIRSHVALINYAVKFGYSYRRWKKIVNVMILKDPGDTRIHRLRVIHIYEADYNMINAIFWRRTIHHCEDHHLLHQGQFGGRPGRSSHDPVIIEELVNAFSRATRRSNIKFANDAASCYDRILVNLACIFSRKYGCPKTVCLVMASNLQDAKYHLKTGLNVTEECYKHSALYPIHGSGQGSGNSPAIWTFISCSLFDMHNEVAHGSAFISFDDTIRVRIHMIGFVDDSTGYCLAKPQESYITLLEKMQHDAQCWSDLLHLSGGSLEFQKCLYHLTHYEFLASGEPFLLPSCPDNNRITLHTFNRDQSTNIQLQSNYDDHKTLGYWKSPSGNQISQIAKLKQKSDRHARVVQSAPLSRREAWTYYFSIYIPSCSYPLPSSHMSEQSLNSIQKEATRSILAKCGYNRNFPRAVVFGPASYGGLSFRNLYYEQGIQQILLLLRHWRSASIIGQLFRVVMSWAQFQAGTSEPILSSPYVPLPHLETRWINSLRLALHEYNASIEFDTSMVPPLQRDHDSYIMDHVINSEQFTPKEICKINYCPLYLQAITVSDISNADGCSLDTAFLIGERYAYSSYTNKQKVKQAKPNQQSWRLWRSACQLFSNNKYKLHQQLGKWHHNAVNLHRCWYSYISNDQSELLVRNRDTYDLYHRIQESNIYTRSSEDPDDLLFSTKYHPVYCKPHIKGYMIIHNPGIRSIKSPIKKRRRSSFFDHISLMPSWQFYLLNGVDMVMPVKYIRQCFELQNLVVCSDGSVVNSDGSFGWVIATREGQRLVKCSGPAFGCSFGDSFRAEAYGVLSWMTFFYVFQSQYNIRPPSDKQISTQTIPYLDAFTDNEGVIRRIESQMQWKYLSPACTLLPDWDVINQICTTMQNKIPTISITHVKGHQDDISSFRDLPLEAQLNVEADELAGAYQQKHSTVNRSKVHQFPSNSAQLQLQGKTITSKYARTLRFSRSHAPLKAYLIERNSWTLNNYDNVHWDSFAQAIKKTTLPNQFVNKLVHRHLPVAKKVNLYDRHENSTCCFCQSEVETQLHLFRCQHKDLVNLRRTLFQRLRKKCDDLKTDPILRDTLLIGLESFLEDKDLVSDNQDLMTNLIHDQESIGWSNVIQGHFHHNWATKYDDTSLNDRHENKLNGTYWTTSITLLTWQWAHEYWKERNSVRTGIENEIFNQKQREKAEREVKFLYDLKHKICANDRDILSTPLDVQLESTTTSLNNWVTVWRPVILRSLSRAITFAITNVRSIKEYFPPI